MTAAGSTQLHTRPQIDDVDMERLSRLGSDHLMLTGATGIALAEGLRDRSAYRRAQRGNGGRAA